MQTIVKFLITLFTTVSIFCSNLVFPGTVYPESKNFDFSYLEYPDEAIITLEEAGLTEQELVGRASAQLPEYVQSGGYDDINGITISPYYTAKVSGEEIPVYASVVFIRVDDTGTLHSFSEIYVDSSEEFSFNIEITGADVELKNAIVLPESHGVEAQCKNNTVKASINKTGVYTFLFNDANQYYGYTLMVREKVDEDKEIAAYIEEYGEDNVWVLDKGVYEYDYVNLVGNKNLVIYLREGAYVIANHLFDIDCAEDENKYLEPTAPGDNAFGLTRYPFINFYKCENITLAGRGVIDMTRLDRRERRGVVFTNCNDVTVKDVKIINSPEWSFISYCCTDVDIDNVDIIGNRGNCDGFAICNSHNVSIDNCFARVADDTFEVKALGGTMDSKSITFTNCIAWGGYARCFGITGEVNKRISDVTFRDCAVIYRDGIWDNDRIGSLVVVAEQTEGSIDGVLFENIEIFRDEGRPILVKIYDEEAENFEIKNVVFRNVSYTSYMSPKIAGTDSNTNTVQVELDGITANGNKLQSPEIRFIIGKHCEVTSK
ncbi:MAG: hypothetical protein E7530_06655 [Ruminococcaceae bacterium]|nr:hypothetical protein [Oscillospiraceae bacterium]